MFNKSVYIHRSLLRLVKMRNYRYIHKNSSLSEEQKEFYEENGYLLIKNNVSDELLNKVCQRFVDFCNGKVDINVTTVMKDPSLKTKGVQGEYLINKIQDFLYDDGFWEYASNKGVVDIIENIVGPNITGVHSMFINKPPNAEPGASLHPLHQDLHYFPFRPADRIAASWTAVERVDERNGCLYVVPGSHKPGILYKHEYSESYKNALYHGVRGFDHLPKVHVVMEKGDTVFFHPLILHGSGPNYTKGFRKAISCHYADSNSYFIDVRGTTQENIAKEIEELVKKKGANVSYIEIWKGKSRLVRGVPGAFQNVTSHL